MEGLLASADGEKEEGPAGRGRSHGDGTALGGMCQGRVGGRNYARREGLVLINAF